ncbi:MAG TPA: FtsX-like permease family protein [Candidatus Limnocylindrales bacterium]|nr:FtsX-like permease family protein [Candidatus Limnocylindrales bacterium]
MSLTTLALRSLRARPARVGLSVLGVALGVAVLFAGLATDAGVDTSVATTVRDLVGRADLRVAAFSETGLSAGTVQAIAGTPGVAVTTPVLERRTYLEPPLSGATALLPPVTVLGIDPRVDGRLHDLVLVAGSALADPGEHSALITERLAAQDGLGLGSPISMRGAGDQITYRVVGIVAGDGPLTGDLGRTVIVPLATAQAVFGMSGVSRVDIGLAPGADPAAVTSALESRLTREPYVLSSPQDLATALRASTTDFRATTALIAAVALFAGAFLIFNTLSMTVTERIREVGLLRAAGARRGQVMSFMLTQALAIGIVGSLVGLAIGALLAVVMVTFVRTIGSVTLDRPAFPPDAIAIAVVVGVAVTLAAALEPARRASRIQPVEALKARLDRAGARSARLRWLTVVFVVVAIVGLLVLPRPVGDAGVIEALLVYGALLVGTLLIPFLLPAMARIAGAPFALLLRFEARIARSSVVRDPSRTALTLGGLTIGLAMIVALGGVGQNARAAAAGWIADVIPGELVATSIRPIAADEGVADQIRTDVPGITRVSPIGTFDIALAGVRTDAAAVVGADMLADGRLRFVAGDRATALAALDAGGATIVPAALADRLGLTVGGTIAVPAADGGQLELRIAGVVERSIPGKAGEAMLVGWTDATTRLGVAGADLFAIRFAPDAPASARDALRSSADELALEVVPLDRIEGAISDALGRIFGSFDALAAIAVVIAALGIVNTLTMNVIERVREIGILRAAGMTRRQVWRSVVVEAGVLGLAGAILGIGLGLVVGAIMVALTGGRPDIAAGIPWSIVGLALVLGVVVAMLAAAYPARIASRLSIVRAVQYE